MDEIQTWSNDPITKVSSIIVSPGKRRIGYGYNGFPQGVEETPERWERPAKYKYSVHAEKNAMNNAWQDIHGWTLYVTYPPCNDCAKDIIQRGIARVVWRSGPISSGSMISYEALDMIEEAGICVERYTDG
jgi:dCMP deaminase